MRMVKFVPVFLVWMVLSLSHGMTDPGIPPDWYVDSFIHTHHSIGKQGPEWDDQLAAVRPEAVQFHLLPGRAGFPDSAELTIDPEAIHRMQELSDKYEVAFVATVSRSGQWRDVAPIINALPPEEQTLFFKRIHPDGSSAGRFHLEHICYHSPGIYRHIVPTYRRIIEGFAPKQIWIDHTVVTVNLCYCAHCREQFHARYGVTPPEASNDTHWDEWVAYHREGFEKWMQVVHDIDPEGTLITYNHAYFISQPEPPPWYVRNLSADIHSHPLINGLYARYASTVGLPFDLMPGLTDRWAGTIPKTPDEVIQTAAVITANGGRWHIGEFPMSRDAQPVDEMLDLAVAGAEFVRARQPWTHNTEAVPLVAVLQSASTQYARVIPGALRGAYAGAEQHEPPRDTPDADQDETELGLLAGFVSMDRRPVTELDPSDPALSRIYFHNNRSVPDEILGIGTALLENNVPFDIINEATLKERLDEYRILVVGDQFRLDDETVHTIARFVEQGGGLLATGRTIESGLAGLLGVRLESAGMHDRAILPISEGGVPVLAPLGIRAHDARVLTSFGGDLETPAVTLRTVGQGHAMYIAADFFSSHVDSSPYSSGPGRRTGNREMRSVVGTWLNRIAPTWGYACAAPPWVEVALRTRGDDVLIHLVERTFEWRNDRYHVISPVELTLPLDNPPAHVRLQPGDRQVDWNWQDTLLQVSVPIGALDTHAIVEVLPGNQ